MDAGLAVEVAALASQKSLNDIIERGDSDVQSFYNCTTLFITGGTGFVGKPLIEKLFRSCNIKKLYMLMRPKKGKSIHERLDELLKDPLFEILHNKQKDFAKKIIIIEGDIAELDLGICCEDRYFITEEVEIIFHVGATVSFQEPLRSATLTNVRGTREVIGLAKQCTRLKALVHVSTAYAHGTISRSGSVVLEKFYPVPISPELMITLADNVEEDRLNKIMPGLIYDWPNTYSFTKALAEELVRTYAADLPTCVIRPAIVISTSRHAPCPGWVDISSVYGPSGFPLGTLLGVIHALHTKPEIKLDLVPVNYVCNAAIVSALPATEKRLKIYQVGSSCRNYLTWGYLTNIIENKIRTTVISERAIWYCFVVQTTNKWLFWVYQCLLHDIPAFIIDGILVMMRKPPRMKKMYGTVKRLLSIVTVYTTNDWIFDDRNTLELYVSLSESDKAIYYHDIKDLDWAEMILIWYIGLRKYIVKDGLMNTELGMKRQYYFKIATYVITGLFIYCLWILFRCIFSLPFMINN